MLPCICVDGNQIQHKVDDGGDGSENGCLRDSMIPIFERYGPDE